MRRKSLRRPKRGLPQARQEPRKKQRSYFVEIIGTTSTEKTTEDEGEQQQEQTSPETLAKDAAAVLAALSTPTKQKGKRKRETSMYFKAKRSTRIKVGKPQPPPKEPIIITDAPTKKKEESPSKISITYERGSPKTSTWKEKIRLMDTKTVLQEAKTSLQEMLSKLKETEKLEEEIEKQSQEEDKTEEIPE